MSFCMIAGLSCHVILLTGEQEPAMTLDIMVIHFIIFSAMVSEAGILSLYFLCTAVNNDDVKHIQFI